MPQSVGTARGFLPRHGALALVLRFGAAGAVNTLFGYLAFTLFLKVGLGSATALASAMVCGVVFNFQTARRFVFRSTGRSARFVAVYLVVFALNWVALRAAMRAGIGNPMAQAFLALPAAALAFLGQRFFVFNGAGKPTIAGDAAINATSRISGV